MRKNSVSRRVLLKSLGAGLMGTGGERNLAVAAADHASAPDHFQDGFNEILRVAAHHHIEQPRCHHPLHLLVPESERFAPQHELFRVSRNDLAILPASWMPLSDDAALRVANLDAAPQLFPDALPEG